MSVVSPVTAVGATVIAALAGLVAGERLSPLALAGVSLALVAVALVSAAPAPGAGEVGTGTAKRSRARWRDGLRQPGLLEAAGSALGFALFYIALKRAGASPSLWPVAATRLGSVPVLLLVALATRGLRRPDLPALRLLLLTAALDACANALYLVAARGSLLSLAAVLTSLYPASTVLLARLLLGERMTPPQVAGMGLAVAGVALIAAG